MARRLLHLNQQLYNVATRTINTSAAAHQAEAAVAVATQSAAEVAVDLLQASNVHQHTQQQPQQKPRWMRELGAIRTDWT
jgi:hypothetical protein